MISILVARDGSDIVFHITDSGVGIAPEDCQLVFEKFERTKRGGRDIGVWMEFSLVCNLIDLRGEHAKIVADDRIGTDVEFRVPALPSTVPAS